MYSIQSYPSRERRQVRSLSGVHPIKFGSAFNEEIFRRVLLILSHEAKENLIRAPVRCAGPARGSVTSQTNGSLSSEPFLVIASQRPRPF